jgi:hypothetical protein
LHQGQPTLGNFKQTKIGFLENSSFLGQDSLKKQAHTGGQKYYSTNSSFVQSNRRDFAIKNGAAVMQNYSNTYSGSNIRACPPAQQSDRFSANRANKTEHSSRGSQEIPVGTLKQTNASQAVLQENSISNMSEAHQSPRKLAEPMGTTIKATVT